MALLRNFVQEKYEMFLYHRCAHAQRSPLCDPPSTPVTLDMFWRQQSHRRHTLQNVQAGFAQWTAYSREKAGEKHGLSPFCTRFYFSFQFCTSLEAETVLEQPWSCRKWLERPHWPREYGSGRWLNSARLTSRLWLFSFTVLCVLYNKSNNKYVLFFIIQWK